MRTTISIILFLSLTNIFAQSDSLSILHFSNESRQQLHSYKVKSEGVYSDCSFNGENILVVLDTAKTVIYYSLDSNKVQKMKTVPLEFGYHIKMAKQGNTYWLSSQKVTAIQLIPGTSELLFSEYLGSMHRYQLESNSFSGIIYSTIYVNAIAYYGNRNRMFFFTGGAQINLGENKAGTIFISTNEIAYKNKKELNRMLRAPIPIWTLLQSQL